MTLLRTNPLPDSIRASASTKQAGKDPVMAMMGLLHNPEAMRQHAASVVLALWAARQLDRGLLEFAQHGAARRYDLSTVLSDTFRLALLDRHGGQVALGVSPLLWNWFCWIPWQKAVYHEPRSRLYLTAPGSAGYNNYLGIAVRRGLWLKLSQYWTQQALAVRNFGSGETGDTLDQKLLAYQVVSSDAALFRDGIHLPPNQ